MAEIRFEVVKGRENDGIVLPTRSTKNSAGYDFYAPEDIIIPSIWDEESRDYSTVIPTGVKATFPNDLALLLLNRSSLGINKGIRLSNAVGLIDSDFYGNDKNDGEICFAFYNTTSKAKKIRKGERIGQGVFIKFFTTVDDNAQGTRTGGIGSTGD